MLKPPPGLTSINKCRPRQKEILALLTDRPRNKTEIVEATGMKTCNAQTTLQKMIANAKIIPNPTTGKYEIYNKNQ